MKMVDKIEMSLDDIIKQNKGGRTRGTARRGRGTAGTSPRRGARGASRAGGGVMRGRNRGGITRASASYTRVSTLCLIIQKKKQLNLTNLTSILILSVDNCFSKESRIFLGYFYLIILIC